MIVEPGLRKQHDCKIAGARARTFSEEASRLPAGAKRVFRGEMGPKSGFPREKRAENPVFRGKTAISLL